MSGRIAVLAGGLLLCAGALHAQAPASGRYLPAARGGRASYDLDRGWLYLRDSAREPGTLAAPAAWTPVDLPHGTAGWYRRDITVGDTAGVRYLLHFEAAGPATDVFVNGARAGGHEGGGVGFDVALTPLLRPGESNRLDVRVDDDAAAGLAASRDCGLSAGIPGDVSLSVLPATRLTGLRIGTPDVTGFSARAELSVDLVQAGEPADYAVETAILAPGGDVVARRTQAAPTPGGTRTVSIELPPVKAPKLWSPASPTLYTARVRLLANGKRVDEMSDRFGFRWYQFREGVLYLNGEPLPIRGSPWREDSAAPGGAAADAARRQALASIRAAGDNVVRLEQHPYAPGLYRAADELGLLLWDGLPWCDGGAADTDRQAGLRRLLEEQIRQNFNHPSIIGWSLGARPDPGQGLPPGDQAARLNAFVDSLNRLAHALDPGRLTAFRGYAGAAGLVDVVEETLAPAWR